MTFASSIMSDLINLSMTALMQVDLSLYTFMQQADHWLTLDFDLDLLLACNKVDTLVREDNSRVRGTSSEIDPCNEQSWRGTDYM